MKVQKDDSFYMLLQFSNFHLTKKVLESLRNAFFRYGVLLFRGFDVGAPLAFEEVALSVVPRLQAVRVSKHAEKQNVKFNAPNIPTMRSRIHYGPTPYCLRAFCGHFQIKRCQKAWHAEVPNLEKAYLGTSPRSQINGTTYVFTAADFSPHRTVPRYVKLFLHGKLNEHIHWYLRRVFKSDPFWTKDVHIIDLFIWSTFAFYVI